METGCYIKDVEGREPDHIKQGKKCYTSCEKAFVCVMWIDAQCKGEKDESNKEDV